MGRGDLRGDIPIGGSAEGHPLALPLDNHPSDDRLHAASGQTLADLAPQHRRDLVAVKAVENAAGLLGVNKAGVEFTSVDDGPLDCLASDFVKNHALHGDSRLERLKEVPGDGLAFAVLVRGEVELGRVFEHPFELGDLLLLVSIDDVIGLEPIVNVNGELAERPLFHVLGEFARVGQVPDVADRRLDVELGAEISGDALDLCRRLDDDELTPLTCCHGIPRAFLTPRAADSSLRGRGA